MKSNNSEKAPEAKVPPDLEKLLSADAKSKAKWQGLTPISRRDFVGWIESAKLAETRLKRIKRVPSMLASGKRRPCCYAIVPMNLYKALGENKKAKNNWKNLTPTEKRDFVSWSEIPSQSESRQLRIEKVCEMLSEGMRKPK